MSSVWLTPPKVNATPCILFIAKGEPRVLAAIVVADDNNFYLTYSKEVKGVISHLVLTSPFVEKDKTKFLVFKYGKRRIKAKGYLIVVESKYELDLLTEEIRYIISASIDVPVKVRKNQIGQEVPIPPPKEGKKVYELILESTPVHENQETE